MWEDIERYQDLIVNGLDLLSFLLITPEVVHLTRPFIQGKSGPIIFRVALSIFAAYILMFLSKPLRVYVEGISSTSGMLIRFLPSIFGVFIGFTCDFWRNKLNSSGAVDRFFAFFSSNLLYIGVMLFFIARMIAFGMASHKIFGVP